MRGRGFSVPQGTLREFFLLIFQNLIIDNQISGINRVLQHAEHPASQQGSRFCLRLAGDCIPQGFHWQDSQPHTEPERMAYV